MASILKNNDGGALIYVMVLSASLLGTAKFIYDKQDAVMESFRKNEAQMDANDLADHVEKSFINAGVCNRALKAALTQMEQVQVKKNVSINELKDDLGKPYIRVGDVRDNISIEGLSFVITSLNESSTPSVNDGVFQIALKTKYCNKLKDDVCTAQARTFQRNFTIDDLLNVDTAACETTVVATANKIIEEDKRLESNSYDRDSIMERICKTFSRINEHINYGDMWLSLVPFAYRPDSKDGNYHCLIGGRNGNGENFTYDEKNEYLDVTARNYQLRLITQPCTYLKTYESAACGETVNVIPQCAGKAAFPPFTKDCSCHYNKVKYENGAVWGDQYQTDSTTPLERVLNSTQESWKWGVTLASGGVALLLDAFGADIFGTKTCNLKDVTVALKCTDGLVQNTASIIVQQKYCHIEMCALGVCVYDPTSGACRWPKDCDYD